MREVCIPYLCTLGFSIWPVSPDTRCTNQLPSPTAMLLLLPFSLSEIPLPPGLFSCAPPIYTLRFSWNVSFPITFPPIPLSGSIFLCLGCPEHSIFSIPSGKYHFVSCVLVVIFTYWPTTFLRVGFIFDSSLHYPTIFACIHRINSKEEWMKLFFKRILLWPPNCHFWFRFEEGNGNEWTKLNTSTFPFKKPLENWSRTLL